MLGIVVPIIIGHPVASERSSEPGGQQPSFHGGVDVVAVNVTVTDGARHYVMNLESQDFRIFEDGRQQEPTFFQKAGVPLAVTLALDTSASMEPKLRLAQEA